MMDLHIESVWTRSDPMPDGHRLFCTDREDLVAIADNSGAFPQDTDDGVLWLDFKRHLMVGGQSPSIPLLTPDSKPISTPTDLATLLLLAVEYDWPINCRGQLLKVYKYRAGMNESPFSKPDEGEMI
jgi:hypothetical protein